jgi:tetraacyldisaccharide 4'-kinase
MIDQLYAAAMRRRRERYAARPDLRLRLRRPVISIGNIAVGGRGKTPIVECVARLLLGMGERPAILSRGYGRRRRAPGVVVVRDATGIRADLERAGDEPLMLARRLPGVAVLVSANRYLAGRLAEHHLGATVHLLDDGFQHLQLDRDLDLVVVTAEDLDPAARTLPTGRLREPPDVLIAADAILAADDRVRWERPGDTPRLFRTRRTLHQARTDRGEVTPGKAVAFAGIADPPRFFEDLRAAGWMLVATAAFRDHHRFSRHDLATLMSRARRGGAEVLLTTEKDYVRLLPYRPFERPIAWVPLTMEPDPLAEFRDWLAAQLRAARDELPPSALAAPAAIAERERARRERAGVGPGEQ